MTDIETGPVDDFDRELEELERMSNGVLELIGKNCLDEAERMCAELKARFPDTIDWMERSAEVHEARGRVDRAVEHYRLCLTHIDSHPDEFDREVREWYQDRIDRLRDDRQ